MVGRKPNLYAVWLQRLVPGKPCVWMPLSHPICVYARNKAEAIWHAIQALKRYPIYRQHNEEKAEIRYECPNQSFNPKLNWYIFWAVGRSHHWIVQADTMKRAIKSLQKEYLRKIYSGHLTSADRLDESNLNQNWITHNNSYEKRKEYSLKLCNNPEESSGELDDIAIQVPKNSCFISTCELCGEELANLAYCRSCGQEQGQIREEGGMYATTT